MMENKTEKHIEVLDRIMFSAMEIQFKEFQFDIDPPVLEMVRGFMKEATKNMIVYQLGKEEEVPTDKDTLTPRRTYVIALPIYIPHIDIPLPYIVAVKVTRIYFPKGRVIPINVVIMKEVKKCLETHIYSQLARTFHNCSYKVGEEGTEIALDRTEYKNAKVVDAYEVLEFHSSGYVWLKESLRCTKQK